MADRRRSFISNTGSVEGTEPDHEPHTPLQISPTLEIFHHIAPSSSLSHKDDKRDERVETHAKLDLSNDDVLAPFTLSRRHLASCLDPKNLEQVNAWGGTAAVLRSLGTDATHGLRSDPPIPKRHGNSSLDRVPTGEKVATMEDSTNATMRRAESGSQASLPRGGNADRLQDVSAVSIEHRRRAYGANVVPHRKSKSLLKLMWLALKDRVLVSSLRLLPFCMQCWRSCLTLGLRSRTVVRLVISRAKFAAYFRRLPTIESSCHVFSYTPYA
jgi:hypothetical protein